ncbi:MAG: hypothetical protein AB2787_03645 [Candidatus Thiodiazotropha endolucinida]
MKNEELWKSYDSYTSELTKYSRQLAFAGAAICWFFKSPEVTFPKPIIVSLAFIISFFIFDILQYFVSAHLLRWWTRKEEKKMWVKENTIEGEYHKPWWIDSPAFVFFNIKALMLFAAFISIGVEFAKRI